MPAASCDSLSLSSWLAWLSCQVRCHDCKPLVDNFFGTPNLLHSRLYLPCSSPTIPPMPLGIRDTANPLLFLLSSCIFILIFATHLHFFNDYPLSGGPELAGPCSCFYWNPGATLVGNLFSFFFILFFYFCFVLFLSWCDKEERILHV